MSVWALVGKLCKYACAWWCECVTGPACMQIPRSYPAVALLQTLAYLSTYISLQLCHSLQTLHFPQSPTRRTLSHPCSLWLFSTERQCWWKHHLISAEATFIRSFSCHYKIQAFFFREKAGLGMELFNTKFALMTDVRWNIFFKIACLLDWLIGGFDCHTKIIFCN